MFTPELTVLLLLDSVPMQLSQSKQLVAKAQTLTDEEVDEIKEAFTLFDTNHSGT
jgi:Ca2+-binding EF-hand superfamily protein